MAVKIPASKNLHFRKLALTGCNTGLQIISRLAPVKLSGQTYFCSDTTRFWPDKCLSSRIIRLHFTVKYMRTVIIMLYNTTHPTPEFAVTIACSKRSDSGERCGVEKAMKSRGGLGREVRFPLSPLLLPRFYFFALPFTLHCSPLSERLEQATVTTL